MIKNIKHSLILSALYIFSILAPIGHTVYAQGNYNAGDLLPRAEIFVAPRTGSFLVGSTFETQIYIDTKGNNINAIDLYLNFDPKKLSLINPSGGKSIFSVWVGSPYYDNKAGIVSMRGVSTDGIKTSSALIVTMTFKVIGSGQATISVNDKTSAYLTDGYGSEVLVTKGRASYTLNNPPPEGVAIYSETHPSSDSWYNNSSPIFGWDVASPAEGFSVLFDTVLQSVPSTTITTTVPSATYTDINDGIWYLHVRPVAKQVWGGSSNFIVRIDTHPPAKFKPAVSKIKDANNVEKYLVSFFTTDSLSGLDYYEVGLVSKDELDKTSPIFIQSESPYIVNLESGKNSRVIIRAYDKAGNVSEEFVDIYSGVVFVQKLKKVAVYLLFIIIFLLLLELILHYLFGHHIIDRVKQGYKLAKSISFQEHQTDFLARFEKPSIVKPEPKLEPELKPEQIEVVKPIAQTPVIKPEVGFIDISEAINEAKDLSIGEGSENINNKI